MAKIHLLDNETINQIAAGEVIENPKSIVKELVENSIDAGADEIIVEIKNGGKSFIRISDNGKGIEKDQVEDAFLRHCTSKIISSKDLSSLHTLGFRGEALASIAAVAHVEMITRVSENILGTKIVIEGGSIVSKEDIGCPVGTVITVTDLFYNVPARKKFLKSDASESGNTNEVVVSLALSSENISFKYINNNNIAFRTPKTDNLLNIISCLYEKDLYNSLLKINYVSNVVKISGFTSNLNYYRGNRKQQIVFVNGRIIKHKRISYFIEAAYNTLLPKNKYPACFIKIEIDPSLVDVNVHPAKTEVKFQNEDLILTEVKRAIYSTLRSTNIIKEVTKETASNSHSIGKINVYDSIYENKRLDKSEINENIFEEAKDKDYENIKLLEINLNNKSNNIFEDAIKNSIYEETLVIHDNDNIKENNHKHTNDFINSKENIELVQQSFIEIKKDDRKLPELNVIGILMDTYIICENIEKTEMYMIDQHAAHERINYEKFLKQFNSKEILQQELLVPEVINLSYEDYQIAISNIEIFENLGFNLESFGINAILINNIPFIFKDSNIKDLFYTILDSLRHTHKSNMDLELDKIIKNACVKSVKAGDKLHIQEVKALLKDLGNAESPYTCPHGRPVIIKITRHEIERMFERIQS